ncbi:MAG: alanine racemase [Gemmatimonadota bacterium]|nr:MAG: alanine racemase [Gemmatimonadota bacterium]
MTEYPKTPARPAWVEVDLHAIAQNLTALRQKVGPRKIMGTVKANAYGHGLVEVAKFLENEKIDMLGVSILDEAEDLRRAGITTPILIMGTILPEEADRALELDVTPTLNSFNVAKSLAGAARERGRRVRAHVKIDTGMGRFGELPPAAIDYVSRLQAHEYLEIEGIYTHFPGADVQNDPFTRRQIETFKRIIDQLTERGFYIPIQHAANSSAILNYPESYFTMVRPGDTLYGLYPSERVEKNLLLRPALSWKSKILTLKRVPQGWSISYGRTYITPTEKKIAIIPVGYADGYNRHLSNKGQVLIHGRRAPIIGLVCMDQFMVDVTDIPDVTAGDEVVLIGKQAGEKITVDDLARQLGTINYEIICGISHRVPRMYTK